MIEERKLTVGVRAELMKVVIGMAKGLGYTSAAQLVRDIKTCWNKIPVESSEDEL